MSIRIHSGRWRGSVIPVADFPGLRPTSSRLRETLGNWLRPYQPFDHILDLFAGSGALGIELCSQGTEAVTFVDSNQALIQSIETTCNTLAVPQARCLVRGADQFLHSNQDVYDLILLDPPYSLGDIAMLASKVEDSGLASDRALIYLETQSTTQYTLPSHWQCIQKTQAGQVCIALYQRNAIKNHH